MCIGRIVAERGAYTTGGYLGAAGPPGASDYTSVCLINPSSRGALALADASVFSPPNVTTGIHDDAADVV